MVLFVLGLQLHTACNLQHNATFAAMQPVTVGPAATAEECCTMLTKENAPGGRCNSSGTYL